MTKLKIAVESDTLEGLSRVVEHLKREYPVVRFTGSAHEDPKGGKIWIQNIEVIADFNPDSQIFSDLS